MFSPPIKKLGFDKITTADYLPVCPHCKQDMPTIKYHASGVFHIRYIYTCPHCRVCLGLTGYHG